MRRRRPAPFRYFLFLLILLLMILGGCVSKSHWVWENPEKLTELELLKDKQACRDLASIITTITARLDPRLVSPLMLLIIMIVTATAVHFSIMAVISGSRII